MTRYTVLVERGVQKDIARLHPTTAKRIRAAIDGLADNPRPDGVKKGKGNVEWYRVRVGDYRILYNVDDGKVLVTVVRAAHRSEVYD